MFEKLKENPSKLSEQLKKTELEVEKNKNNNANTNT